MVPRHPLLTPLWCGRREGGGVSGSGARDRAVDAVLQHEHRSLGGARHPHQGTAVRRLGPPRHQSRCDANVKSRECCIWRRLFPQSRALSLLVSPSPSLFARHSLSLSLSLPLRAELPHGMQLLHRASPCPPLCFAGSDNVVKVWLCTHRHLCLVLVHQHAVVQMSSWNRKGPPLYRLVSTMSVFSRVPRWLCRCGTFATSGACKP